MNQLLVISGPTASGKTSLAINLAKDFDGELISADSRQLYRGLDIGTGKDHPKNVVIHLIDILDPNQEFSVAQYQQLVQQKINDIHSRHRLPIVVGGTGQYLDAAINGAKSTFMVKPLPFLRKILNHFPLATLQLILKTIDYSTFKSLNNSDIHNPHRLIRKIEIKLSPQPQTPTASPQYDVLHLSLTADNSFLFPRVDARVESRLKMGLLKEIETLLLSNKWHYPGLNTLAYKEFRPFFEKKVSLSQAVDAWKFDEHALVRRQKTWLAQMANVNFIDISESSFEQNAHNLVKKWYNRS